jgi:hypothetical protein
LAAQEHGSVDQQPFLFLGSAIAAPFENKVADFDLCPRLLLRNIYTRFSSFEVAMADATYFLEKSEQIFRLIKKVRLGKATKKDICGDLQTLANEFLAEAVSLDTERDRAIKSA